MMRTLIYLDLDVDFKVSERSWINAFNQEGGTGSKSDTNFFHRVGESSSFPKVFSENKCSTFKGVAARIAH